MTAGGATAAAGLLAQPQPSLLCTTRLPTRLPSHLPAGAPGPALCCQRLQAAGGGVSGIFLKLLFQGGHDACPLQLLSARAACQPVASSYPPYTHTHLHSPRHSHARALSAFDVHRGRSVPQFSGVVVLAEHAEAVRLAWEEQERCARWRGGWAQGWVGSRCRQAGPQAQVGWSLLSADAAFSPEQ